MNIGSIAGHFIPPINFKFNVYPGTKHAVRATTEVIRRELVKRNNKKIRVAVSFTKYLLFKNKSRFSQEISPGAVDTGIMQAAGVAMPADFDDSKIAEFPWLKPADVAQAVSFLLMTPYSVNITELVIKPTGEVE